tara:strand:- start:2493 stop:2681 length:189 start_codon:yes stop_codon:yes gene_type:complete
MSDKNRMKLYFKDELLLNHEPSLDHWAKIIAEDEMEDGGTNWDYEYSRAWHSIHTEFNNNYV